jgi:dTMP kinase
MASIFAVIEGIDASGKNTQSKLLAERLKAKLFSFPVYETPIGQLIGSHLRKQWAARSTDKVNDGYLIKEDPLVFQALMTMNRYEMAPAIKAEREAGRSVVCDRYFMSGVVYAEVDGVDSKYVHENLSGFLPKPDIHILLDIPVTEMSKRRPEARDRYEADTQGMISRAETYRKWWKFFQLNAGESTNPIIDGVGTIEEVHKRICDAVALVRS